MVLMGGSLAVGCGGLSEQDARTHNTGSGAGGAPSGNTGGGGSGAPTSGGRGNIIGLGGAASGGVAGSVSMTAGAGGQTAPPLSCSSAQWDCSADVPECSFSGTGFTIPNGCICNASRPKTALDCATDEAFVCRNGTRRADAQVLPAPVAFDCRCLPAQSTCELMCDQVNEPGATCTQKSEAGRASVLCNCAVIVLR